MKSFAEEEKAIMRALHLRLVFPDHVGTGRDTFWVVFSSGRPLPDTDFLPINSWRTDLGRLVHRQHWISARNAIVVLLRFLRVQVDWRTDLADATMTKISGRPRLRLVDGKLNGEPRKDNG